MLIKGRLKAAQCILDKQFESDNYKPDTFFTPVGGGCTVMSVAHVAEQRQDKNPCRAGLPPLS